MKKDSSYPPSSSSSSSYSPAKNESGRDVCSEHRVLRILLGPILPSSWNTKWIYSPPPCLRRILQLSRAATLRTNMTQCGLGARDFSGKASGLHVRRSCKYDLILTSGRKGISFLYWETTNVTKNNFIADDVIKFHAILSFPFY